MFVEELYDLLMSEENKSMVILTIPKVRVSVVNGELCSIDNRRLWVFKKIAQILPDFSVEVELETPHLEYREKMSGNTEENNIFLLPCVG
jgi:hypothetical protein